MNTERKRESRGGKELDSGGGKKVLEEMLNRLHPTNEKENEAENTNKNYESNVLNMFLPYANMLETINEDTTRRKRKSGNKKNPHRV